jgi:hypothetical protein
MTVVSCLVVPEGVVFGADSKTSIHTGVEYHYLNHSQKILEFGENSTLAVATWGLTSLRETSFRTLVALIADGFAANPPTSVRDVAERLAAVVFNEYQNIFSAELTTVRTLEGKSDRTPEESAEYADLSEELKIGFCIGGHVPSDRKPQAFSLHVDPRQRSPSSPIPVIDHGFWGLDELFLRLYSGFDLDSREAILNSPFWIGKGADLDELLEGKKLFRPQINIRDAIDFVHFSIYATIKALKFSAHPQVCGGPIELAVITTDRRFRWVEHKDWDSAIG